MKTPSLWTKNHNILNIKFDTFIFFVFFDEHGFVMKIDFEWGNFVILFWERLSDSFIGTPVVTMVDGLPPELSLFVIFLSENDGF